MSAQGDSTLGAVWLSERRHHQNPLVDNVLISLVYYRQLPLALERRHSRGGREFNIKLRGQGAFYRLSAVGAFGCWRPGGDVSPSNTLTLTNCFAHLTPRRFYPPAKANLWAVWWAGMYSGAPPLPKLLCHRLPCHRQRPDRLPEHGANGRREQLLSGYPPGRSLIGLPCPLPSCRVSILHSRTPGRSPGPGIRRALRPE